MAYLSIVIPAYNEERRIGVTLGKIYSFMMTKDYDFEVVLVDDGSADRTVNIAGGSRLAKENKLKILKNGSNKGKGFSVKSGIINSNSEYILFSDADLSTPIEQVDKLFEEMNKGYDVVIGSRGLKNSDVRVHQPWYREIMGKTFNFFVKSILMRGFNDTQCGFKLFKSSVAKEIASKLRINGFSFDVEMLYIAAKKSYKIKEAPVVWLNSPHSKVSPICEPLKMVRDLFLIKIMHG